MIFFLQDYNDIAKWTTTNIYRFSRQLTDFQDYDITGCFEETHTMHLLVKMSWRMDEDLMVQLILIILVVVVIIIIIIISKTQTRWVEGSS